MQSLKHNFKKDRKEMNKKEKLNQAPQAHREGSPAYSFGLKVQRVTTIDDYNLMVLVQEALNGRLRRPCNVASKPSAITRPPEGVALAVLLGEYQKDLRRHKGSEVHVRPCWVITLLVYTTFTPQPSVTLTFLGVNNTISGVKIENLNW